MPDRDDDVWHCKQLLKAAKNREMTVYTSMLTIAECTHARASDGEKIITKKVRDAIEGYFFSAQSGVTPVQPSVFVLDIIKDMAWNDSLFLKGFDSLHVASALIMECEEFLTRDKLTEKERTILMVKHKLNVCYPRATKLLPDKYRATELFNGEKETPD